MKVTPTAIPGVLIIEPKVFGDASGFFCQSFNQRTFKEATGLNVSFVQDNHSCSTKGVLRGLHYLVQHRQVKLVYVLRGAVFGEVVDIRKDSSTLGKWEGIELTKHNHKQFWMQPGFNCSFVVPSESADFLYKTTDHYAPKTRGVLLGTIQKPASSGL
jgi:dTDP-4-dehydrorhamnose 3,5-epimerase